jgi:hypothetical protein
MRLMFVYWKVEDAGSAQTIRNYAEAARALGHEVLLYAPEDPNSRFECSTDIESADGVIFVLEWNIYLHQGAYLDLVQPMRRAPRARRVVIDDDGMYNDVIAVDGDYNHPHAAASRRRTELYDRLSDKICQPTLRPLRPNVRTFLFHAYNPAWEVPLDFRAKEYGMVYVGSNWFRWRAMRRVLRAIEPIRERVGRIALIGHNWDASPYGASAKLSEDAYGTDPAYLRKLGVELMPPVPVERVIPSMSSGIFNPVLVRPTFNYLRLVNPRLFETPAASTIPLFGLEPEYVRELYGEPAVELVLADDAAEQILDVLRRPERYAPIVAGIRRHLAERHSYAARLRQLIQIVES